MINQQLLDFIKSQLSKGLDKETITKELLENGWAENDVSEGFNIIVNTPVISTAVSSDISKPILTQATTHASKKILLIVVSLLIIAGGASGYYFRNNIPVVKNLIKGNDTKVEKFAQNQVPQIKLENPQSQQEGNPVVAETNQEQSLPSQAITSQQVKSGQVEKVKTNSNNKVMDCGTTSLIISNDAQRKARFCFDEQFKNCNLAKVVERSSDATEVEIKEILGKNGKLCLVKMMVLKSENKNSENKEMICKFDNSTSFNDVSVNDIYKCSGALFNVMTDKASYSDKSKTVDPSTGISLDSTQFMFVSPAENSKVKIGDDIQLKIIAGKNIEKVRYTFSMLNDEEDIPLENGSLTISFKVPETLNPLILSLEGWTKNGDLITDSDRKSQGLDTTGTSLILKPYTDAKVTDILGVPDVIEAQKWETPILSDQLSAEFENNALGGLIPIPDSDINFKIEDESIIKLLSKYEMQGLKSGETYVDITYKGITKRVPMYVQ